MNELLFWLYMADVVGDLKTFTGIFSFIGVLVAVVGLTFWHQEMGPLSGPDLQRWWRTAKLAGATIVVLGLMSLVLPSSRFIYTAVAFKAGQEVAQTDTAQRALAALNRKLDEMLDNAE